MRPNESFVGQPIRSLQQMLRVIGENDDRLPSVVPDGIYGNDTVRAVSAFQRSVGLPATGIADQDTWDAIVARYEPALVEQGEAEPLRIILDPGQVIRRGERNPNLYIVQAILIVLSEQYAGILPPSMNGILDIATADSLASFQQMNLIPATGELDKHTWKQLALHYPLAANSANGRE
ncbi:MAG: peptidoglycan-binding protein [Oscillospiraceae bacterium]|nr:peptidoglycan-binding protein [Oscillospiraceae bacterium]